MGSWTWPDLLNPRKKILINHKSNHGSHPRTRWRSRRGTIKTCSKRSSSCSQKRLLKRRKRLLLPKRSLWKSNFLGNKLTRIYNADKINMENRSGDGILGFRFVGDNIKVM